MKRKIHYIPHTHWDKEWYKTYEEFRVKFLEYFTNVLEVLEDDVEFKNFMFDGQSSVIEDYLQIHPDQKDRISKLVSDKKLLIGPWFTLPDNYLTSGESLTRNLLIGKNIAENLGHTQNVCYIPDSFGQSDQMPQIIKEFELKGAILWRGVDSLMTNEAGFNWRGSDGSEVFAVHLPLGYGYSKKLPSDSTSFTYMNEIITNLEKKYKGNNILWMGGSDHEPIQNDLTKVIKKVNSEFESQNLNSKVIISNLDAFFDNYISETDRTKITTLSGELRSVNDQRLHFGDASGRVDLKQLNRNLENKIACTLEPLLSYAKTFFDIRYEKELVNYCWKLMFANQAHDSACATCTDEAHNDIENRFNKIEQIVNELLRLTAKKIAEHSNLDFNYENYCIFNPSPINKDDGEIIITLNTKFKNFKLENYDNENIKFNLIAQEEVNKVNENIDFCNYLSMVDAAQDFKGNNKGNVYKNISFKSYNCKIAISSEYLKPMFLNFWKIKECKEEIASYNSDQSLTFKGVNNIFQVQPNGSLTIKDKNNIFENVGYLESRGDDGDSYDYSPPIFDNIFNTLNEKPKISVRNSSDSSKEIEVSYNWSLPKSLTKDNKKRSSVKLINKIKIKYNFYVWSDKVDISIELNNKSIDHQISYVIPSNVESIFNFAGQQFGTIKRPDYLTANEDWKLKSRSFNYAQYPFQRFVSKHDDIKGIGIITHDSSEYKISQNNQIRIILLRSFGYMGKANLQFRPGRPSGVYWRTPKSYMIGITKFNFEILTYNGVKEFSKFISQVNKSQTPLYTGEVIKDLFFHKSETYQRKHESLVSLDNEKISLSVIKQSEDKNSLILRLYNSDLCDHENVTINFSEVIKEAWISNLNESKIKQLELQKKCTIIKSIKTNQFITIRLEY